MMQSRRTLRSLAFAAAWLVAGTTFAQAYPERPVRMVVPFAPGGATDIIARIVGQKLGERLATQVVIEYKPGAGTTVGNAKVAKAKPVRDAHAAMQHPCSFAAASRSGHDGRSGCRFSLVA